MYGTAISAGHWGDTIMSGKIGFVMMQIRFKVRKNDHCLFK